VWYSWNGRIFRVITKDYEYAMEAVNRTAPSGYMNVAMAVRSDPAADGVFPAGLIGDSVRFDGRKFGDTGKVTTGDSWSVYNPRLDNGAASIKGGLRVAAPSYRVAGLLSTQSQFSLLGKTFNKRIDGFFPLQE
jgi:hypothetical protein